MPTYQEQQNEQILRQLQQVRKDLPPFLSEFFTGTAQTASAKTRLGYAYDLRIFFTYLREEHPTLGGIAAKDFTIEDLQKVTVSDIEEFLEYLTFYLRHDTQDPTEEVKRKNGEKGKSRKLAAVRRMFRYFYKKGKLSADPAALVETPKLHEKQIVRLEINEVADLLDAVESGEHLSKHQKAFHQKNERRDMAIISLLLGTGMRVSECVGIDLTDLDLKNRQVKVTRKGGNESVLYFGEEVHDALADYLEVRENAITKDAEEKAFFLSGQGKRISTRAVQNLVKKYAGGVTVKHITPHKLRSTYGTNLYNETGDIYLVAETLGHADVNTTRKHYAEIQQRRRQDASKIIKLRKD